ncbi:MAG: HEAT repeat domain-containing protein, partial [Pyrinomonadaceae bacterium]
MNKVILAFAIALIVVSFAASQTPLSKLVNIIKAEDARRYDKTLEDLIEDRSEDIKIRAILAAGRIGDAKAVPRLAAMLENGSPKVREMTAFALGEIESINAADAILKAIKAETRAVANVPNVTARLIEAAGKIAAANPKDANAADLGKAILETLEAEFKLGSRQNRDVVLLGLTAALRAKPDKTDTVVANFLTHPDARVRSDAANTLTRIRAKNANETLRKMLAVDSDPVARANAARALGAAEDKGAIDLLIVAATEDKDSRVRVSA